MKEKTIVHALCGLPGSGKTTFAKELERSSSIRFSADDWMIKLYGHHMPRELFDERLQLCTDLILSITKDLFERDVSVVLDFGLWKRADRAYLGAFMQEHSIPFKLYFFDVPQEELWTRLEKRNQNLSEGTFEITKEMLTMFTSWFEPPNETEGFELIRIA